MDIYYNQLFTALGMMGCGCYVTSYFLVQLEIIDGNDYFYVLMNLLASVLMLLSLTQAFNLGSAVLQIMWIVISVVGILRKLKRGRLTTS